MSARSSDDAAAAGLESLSFDPEAILLRDPSLLFDPHFLGALHAELNGELGEGGANLTLLQMGFLHGLHDAFDALTNAFGDPRATANPEGLLAPPLAMQVRTRTPLSVEAALSLSGIWPQHLEATARLQSVGRPAGAGCFLSAGYTSGWLSGTLDADILAVESNCCACGAESCEFAALEASEWLRNGDPIASALLDALPFDALRSFVRRSHDARGDARHDMRATGTVHYSADRFDPKGAIVHIWGPVMVIPFGDGDEALRAVELIGHDSAARDVSVVVVDLTGAIVDETYGALALERIVDLIEAWGAEAIFASVSPLSEPVVADLERQPLCIHKDLAQAIATAFQVAGAQRNPS